MRELDAEGVGIALMDGSIIRTMIVPVRVATRWASLSSIFQQTGLSSKSIPGGDPTGVCMRSEEFRR
jgi:hypothetical protein